MREFCTRWLVPAAMVALATGCAKNEPARFAPPPSPERVAWFPAVTPRIPITSNVDPELRALAETALTSDDAIAELRARGPAGLDAALSVDDGSARATQVIDAVAKQRDARASRLFWFTDLEAAKAAAQEKNRPILSLRLLGRLDQKLSCANSRFFRTVLYPNAAVSDYLRQRFVLHWSSERPAPKIHIDFGDGREMETTITGNSIHYVLDQQGRFVDGIPGLYGPKPFVGTLENAARIADRVGKAAEPERRGALLSFHSERLGTIERAWRADLAFLGVTAGPQPAPSGSTAASNAVPIAMPKAAVEAPMVTAVMPNSPAPTLEQMTTDALWNGIAERHASAAQLDPTTVKIIRAKSPAGLDEATLTRRTQRFEKLMALDTVKNEYLLHREIHRWMTESAVGNDWLAINQRVYAELFLTPRSDPWLGLVDPATYTGLEGDGLSVASPQVAQP